MSADNWAICPKCKKVNDEGNRKRILEAGKKYGKVSPDEFINLMKVAKKPKELEATMREDYEIHMDENGFFEVNYSCACQDCGFRHTFKQTEQVWKSK